MRKTWIAQNADSVEELVLSQENALAFTKINVQNISLYTC